MACILNSVVLLIWFKVMIVNVNPFDTGYHENSSVMEFAALASEVSTNTTKLPLTILKPTHTSDTTGSSMKGNESLIPKRQSRQVRLSLAPPGGGAPVERVIEVVEGAFVTPLAVSYFIQRIRLLGW